MNQSSREEELKIVEDVFRQVSKKISGELLIHDHDWPNLSILWNDDENRKKLQLYLNSNKKAYSLTIYKTNLKDKGSVMKTIKKDFTYPFSELDYEYLIKCYEMTNAL